MIRHPLLDALGLDHGFGECGDLEPPRVQRPRQVHGDRVVPAAACLEDPPPEADCVLGVAGEGPVAVVTADCVPVLLASEDGRAVAAVHAGWRGLAKGVLEAGVVALRRQAPGSSLRAVVGPHIGPCCYEVDAPVLDALAARHGPLLTAAIAGARRGLHADLDLGVLAREVLLAAGIAPDRVGRVTPPCTSCDPERFHSYRRDGPRSGRLVHYIRAGLRTPRHPGG